MSITQFNATYTPDEDRVLFRFNTSESQEYRLWLTRLIVRDVLALGAQASVAVLAKEHPPEQAKAIAEFKQQAKAQNPNFTTFVPATQFPLGADPVLVHKVRFTIERQVTRSRKRKTSSPSKTWWGKSAYFYKPLRGERNGPWMHLHLSCKSKRSNWQMIL